MYDVTLAFILFQIMYIKQEVWVFRKSKPSRNYCFEIAKQIAALKFQKDVLSGELRVTKIDNVQINNLRQHLFIS